MTDSMVLLAAAIVLYAVLPAVASEQPATRTQVAPLFSDFPVSKLYSGPTASPKLQNASNERYLRRTLSTATAGPNFSGQFRLVRFQTGNGPIGAALVDSETGSVFRLPHEIVRDDFFIHDTDCLSLYRKWQRPDVTDEQDDSVPLSFKATSELLIVRQCRVAMGSVHGVEKSYYRWHGRKWHLLKRISLPPPPPAPVP
jgi:hypothetical protein